MGVLDNWRFAKVGPISCCVYCGAIEELSNEHVVPLGLDGTIQLVKASCPECCKITGKFEGAVLRTMFGNMRIRHGMASRRRGKRPSMLPAIAVSGGVEAAIDIPSEQHPAPAPVIWFKYPAILEGREPCPTPFTVSIVATKGVEPNEVGADALRFSIGLAVPEFCQMLAKIAHCATVMSLGIDGFDPLLIPAILGQENASNYVGGSPDMQPCRGTTDKRNMHELSVHPQEPEQTSGMIAVRIRLFSNWMDSGQLLTGMPIYWVASGRTNSLTYPRFRAGIFCKRLN